MPRFIAVVLLTLVTAAAAQAESKQVWQIGKFDQSYREFRGGPVNHVNYQVGKSDWTKDWPYAQSAGSSADIEFTLADAPHGTFLLKMAVEVWLPGVPAMQVELNGHKGIYYCNPKLSYAVDDGQAAFDPHFSTDTLSIPLPAEYMRRGPNHLILTVLSQPAPSLARNISDKLAPAPSPTVAAPFYADFGYAGIRYDALSLENDARQSYVKAAVTSDITPTVFYRRGGDTLSEIVQVTLRFAQGGPATTVTLSLLGRRYVANVPAHADLGEEKVLFEIPEWSGTVHGTLQVTPGLPARDVDLAAARKWTIFVVPHTHIDVGYTDFQGKVAEAQARSLAEAMTLQKQHPDFRFAMDGSWTLEQYLATRSLQQQREILQLIRDQKIGLPVQYASLLTGLASLETLYRSFYYSKALSRKYSLPFDYANTTDVPTYTGAYPSILAGSGVRYWTVGGDNARGSILTAEPWNEKSPFWWQGPDGGEVLFWYSRCYEQVMFLFGLPPQEEGIYESLPIFLQAYSKPDYKPNVALIFGTQPENTDLSPETASFATGWNSKFAYPELKYSTFQEFFRYLEKNYGNDLPTYKGDMGPYWEDGAAADALSTARNRQNESDTLAAEVASTVSHILSPDLKPPKEELDDAWKNIVLFAEHTWTSGNSVSQPSSQEAIKQLAVKDNRATQAAFEAEDISNRALSQLADVVHIPMNTLLVFNSLSWERDAVVEADLNMNEQITDPSTKQVIPYEVLSRKENFLHVRFVAPHLPPIGYKCFLIASVPDSTPADPAMEMRTAVENRYYKILVDPNTGSVQSIYDKQLQRELVDTHSPYRFGQYLYVTGGGDNSQIIWPNLGLPPADLQVHPAEKGEYLGTNKTPWGYAIHLQSSSLNTPSIGLDILLYNDEKRIEFRYQLKKESTNDREAAYFAFPLALSKPQFTYASQQGWVDPAKDMFKGGNVDWFSIQKWMAASDAGMSVAIVPVDAPLATFGDITRGKWPTTFQPASSTVFSYIMNNYWATNYAAAQGGTFRFRYVLTSTARLDPPVFSRLGWESMQPLLVNHVILQDKLSNPDRPLPAEGASFLKVSSPNVAVVAWKLREDGEGTVLRLQELAGEQASATVELPRSDVKSAHRCNAVEDELESLQTSGGNEIQVTLKPHEVQTICIQQ